MTGGVWGAVAASKGDITVRKPSLLVKVSFKKSKEMTCLHELIFTISFVFLLMYRNIFSLSYISDRNICWFLFL